MGIPKFFRYMSERYPCLSELVRDDQIPEFDNLYLDMNGIIHPCSHPDDGNVHFRISEETIFRNIFNYVDKLFFLIKPRKLFVMAVDGVAPRAKMNQQRSRRFRSAKEAEMQEKNALNRGEKLPDTARFDSNCITPGTEFMVRLQEALKYFVKLKMSTNPLWQRCRIILSGHETPGEGEHKIMEYIRYLKSQPGYDINTRHCLYGLDADLIVLGLCTHEMHFSLLREEVNFGKKAKKVSLEEIRFYLLHLNLLREYLELEFGSLKSIENKEFNINKIIDDWILMGFLVGNDFIPHLPNFHINTNALPLFYKIYKKVWPQMDGYLNENGMLNLSNFEIFMEKLSELDIEMFNEIAGDFKYIDGKTGKVPAAFDFDASDSKQTMSFDLAKMIEESNNMYGGGLDDDLSDEDAILEKEFEQHKRNYYISKLGYPEMTPEVLVEQTECYIRALQWILFYYYKGVSSWGWYYPHHYAPYASDIKNFKHLQLKYDIGKPFLPFEQLLAVLPAASKGLLPEAYRDLMTNPNSEIIDYYPTEFQTDLNGKKQEWEAVVLIPFIDEGKLLKAMTERFPQLLMEERNRNIHGPMLQYDYNETSQGEYPGIFSFKKINNIYCTETTVWRDKVKVTNNYLDSDISKWPQKRTHMPGFPTMKYLKYTGELQRARIKVFEQPSRNDTMILLPEIKQFGELEQLAKEYLGRVLYIGWPHLIKSNVCGILIEGYKATPDGVVEVHQRLFEAQLKNLEEHTINRMGIKFRETKVLVIVNTLTSVEYVVGTKGKMVATCIWSNTEVSYPLQGVVMDICTEEELPESKMEDFYPIGSPVFMLSSPYFGCEGKILDPKLVYTCGRIQVNITVIPEPQLEDAKQIHTDAEQAYYNSYVFSAKSGLGANIIARITGSVFIIHGAIRQDLQENTPKTNIGLNLKSKKSDQQVAGYVRKQGNTWQYSQKTFDLVMSYYDKFPEVFNLLISNTRGSDEFFEEHLYPSQTGEKKLSDITMWLKQQTHNNADRVPCGTKWVECEAIEAIKKAVDELKAQPVKSVKLQVKPHLLLKHGLEIPQAFRSKSNIRLFDRVVVVKKTYQVPVGYKGTVIAIHPMVDSNPVRIECIKQIEKFLEVLFDKELPNVGDENDGELKRIARVAQTSVLVVYQPLDEQIIAPVQNPHMRQQNVNIPDFNNDFKDNSTPISKIEQQKRNLAYFIQPPTNNKIENQRLDFGGERNTSNARNDSQNSNISFGGNKTTSQVPFPTMVLARGSTAQSNDFVQDNRIMHRQFTNATSRPKVQQNTGSYLNRSWSPVNEPDSRPSNDKHRRQDNSFGSTESYHADSSKGLSALVEVNTPLVPVKASLGYQNLIEGIDKGMGEMSLNQTPPPEVVKSTEMLKQLLGMNLSSTATREPPTQNNKSDGRKQSMNPNQQQKNSISLPKPPSNWTNDAFQQNNRRMDARNPFPHIPSQQLPAPLPFNNMYTPCIQPIQRYSNQYYTTMPLHVDKRYASAAAGNNHNVKSDNQMCPSRETRVSNISTGPSAFIPLQAMKSIRRNDQQKPTTSKQSNNQQSNVPPVRSSQNAIEEPPRASQDIKTAMSSSTVEEPKVAKSAPPKIRKPKIAANFDFKG